LLFIGTLFIDPVKPEHGTRGRANLTGWSIKQGEEFASPFDFEVKNAEKPLTPNCKGKTPRSKHHNGGGALLFV